MEESLHFWNKSPWSWCMIRGDNFYNFVESYPLSLQKHCGEHWVMKSCSWAKPALVLVETAVYDHFGVETSLPKDRSPTWEHFLLVHSFLFPLFFPSIHPSIHPSSIHPIFSVYLRWWILCSGHCASFWRWIGIFFPFKLGMQWHFICMLPSLISQDFETFLVRVWKISLLS